MRASHRRHCFESARPTIESLEERRFLSAALPLASISPISPTPIPPISTSTLLFGTRIYAQANQPFRAVIGTIRALPKLPAGYTLEASIDWGDASADSQAKLLRQPDGFIALLGSHNYQKPALDDITITLTADPPPGTLLPIRLIGTIHSKARVIAPNGGVTLNESARIPFTANLGTFRSSLSSSTMTALIDWGDGTSSVGKILALPVANPLAGGTFAVFGAHTYARAGSHLVHITVYSRQVFPPTAAATPSVPPIILVAQFDSVIDVLPVSPIAATA